MRERLPKKFLCTREGAVGTAHENRDGKTVDFYPVRAVVARMGETHWWTTPNEHVSDDVLVEKALVGATLQVAGRTNSDVTVPLPRDIAERGVDERGNAFVRVATGVRVTVEGYILTITQGTCATWPSRDQRAQREAAAIERDRAIANAKGAETLTPRKAAKITQVVFKHLEKPAPWAHKAALDRFYNLLLSHFGIERIEALPEWLHNREIARVRLLETRSRKTS